MIKIGKIISSAYGAVANAVVPGSGAVVKAEWDAAIGQWTIGKTKGGNAADVSTSVATNLTTSIANAKAMVDNGKYRDAYDLLVNVGVMPETVIPGIYDKVKEAKPKIGGSTPSVSASAAAPSMSVNAGSVGIDYPTTADQYFDPNAPVPLSDLWNHFVHNGDWFPLIKHPAVYGSAIAVSVLGYLVTRK